jgi:hypothetical protein
METGLPTDGRMGGHTPVFLKAVEHYGQHGRNKKLPKDVEAALVGDHPTTHYIWRTAGDKNVRPEHAENDGRIFSWNKPPRTGHPGAEYGCRCWAEPHWQKSKMEEMETSNPHLAHLLNHFRALLKKGDKWANMHFVAHFYVGRGKPVTLEQIGHLESIKWYYLENYLWRFRMQLYREAPASDGKYKNSFAQSYGFKEVQFSHGGATISGEFDGEVYTVKPGERICKGNTVFHFHDVFTDPLSIVETIKFFLPHEQDVWPLVKQLSEVGGVAYHINGSWEWPMGTYIRNEA